MILKELKITSGLLLSACLAANVNGQVINSQDSSIQCGLLKSNIYCFGGSSSDSNLNIIMLDLLNNDGKKTSYLNSQWNIIKSNPSNVSLENRISFQASVLPTGTQMLINGGYNSNRNISIADQTIVYDATNNVWTKGQNYFEESFGNRQIFAASSVYIPSRGVAYFGGQEQHANASLNMVTSSGANSTTPGVSAPIPFIDNGLTRIAGYSQLTLYDAKNNIWSVPTPQSKLPQVYSFHQSSIYDPTSKNVYFFGGYYYDTSLPNFDLNNPSKHSFAYAVTFNSVTGNWGSQNLTGFDIPSSRAFHTTTLLPSTGRSVLLYGGSNGVTESPDYCYTLDLFTRDWSQHTIDASNKMSLTRSHHAAVLASDDLLFIISGATSDNRLIILDIGLPAYITLSDTYSSIAPSGGSFSAPENDNNNVKTIAAAVASVGCFLIAVGAALFCFFRRRKARASRLAKEEQNEGQQCEQVQLGQQNYSEPPPPYIPPRPFPAPQNKMHPQGEEELNWSQFNNVKSKYLSDCDDSTSLKDKKVAPPMYHHGKASGSGPEEFDLGFGDEKKTMPTKGESSYSANKPDEMMDKKM